MCFSLQLANQVAKCSLNDIEIGSQSSLIATQSQQILHAFSYGLTSQLLNGLNSQQNKLFDCCGYLNLFFHPFLFSFQLPCLKLKNQDSIGLGEGEERRLQWLNEQDCNAECTVQHTFTFRDNNIISTQLIGNRVRCSIHSISLAWGGQNKCINNIGVNLLYLVL